MLFRKTWQNFWFTMVCFLLETRKSWCGVMGVLRRVYQNIKSSREQMYDITQCLDVAEGLNGSKIHVYTRHFTCKDDIHRCCEYVIETPIDFLQMVKTWIVFSILLVCLNSCLKEFDMTFFYIFGIINIIIIFKLYFYVNKESVLIEMEMLGIQQTTTYWLGWKVTEILHKEDIVDVVINEAVTMSQVIFYLAVIMKDRTLKPLFLHSKPRLKCLKKIYAQIQVNLSNQKDFSETRTSFFNSNTKRKMNKKDFCFISN